MNYTSNLWEVVRTLFPLLPLSFLSAFFISVCLYCYLTLQSWASCSLDHPHNNTVHPRWFVFQRRWLCLCSLQLWKRRLCRNQRSNAASHRFCLSCLSHCPLSRLTLSSLPAFPFSSSSFIYIFPHFSILLEQRVAAQDMGIKARWSKS